MLTNLWSHLNELCPSADRPYRRLLWKAAMYLSSVPRSVLVLASDPSSVEFAPSLIKSFFPGYSLLSDQIPWITFKARVWLESYLKRNMTAFEYGSGGSTLFISRRVSKLVSVEHDRVWYERVSSMLPQEGILNCECVLHEPENIVDDETLTHGRNNYTSTRAEYAGMIFESYVKSIEEYPDGRFDLVLIDGRARLSCIPHALSKIRPGGYLMFDDAERPEFAEVMSLLCNYRRIDFLGARPYVDFLTQTSIWEIKPKRNFAQLRSECS